MVCHARVRRRADSGPQRAALTPKPTRPHSASPAAARALQRHRDRRAMLHRDPARSLQPVRSQSSSQSLRTPPRTAWLPTPQHNVRLRWYSTRTCGAHRVRRGLRRQRRAARLSALRSPRLLPCQASLPVPRHDAPELLRQQNPVSRRKTPQFRRRCRHSHPL
jgi:hypothetical protein